MRTYPRYAKAVPLYQQVKEALEREIARMAPGDALPTEPELEKRFSVSRITVRRALDEMASVGVVVRQQGRGTFVREPQITQELTELMSWKAAMQQMGYEPGTISCEMDLVDPPYELGMRLKSNPGEQVVRVRRVRDASGEPICVMVNYLPEGLVPDLLRKGLVEDSIYSTLAAHNLYPVRAEDTVEARPATEWEAEVLQMHECSPILQVTRLAYDMLDRPLYVAVTSSRADKYRYTAHHDRR